MTRALTGLKMAVRVFSIVVASMPVRQPATVKMYHPHGDFPFYKRQQDDLKAFVEEHPEVRADVEKLRVLR